MTDSREERRQIDDDRFDALLERLGDEYNPPPATPRDAMWSRIQVERRQRGLGSTKVIQLRQRTRPWLAWGAGVAAALAIGIGIGSISLQQSQEMGPATPSVAVSPPADSTPVLAGEIGSEGELVEADEEAPPGLDELPEVTPPRAALVDRTPPRRQAEQEPAVSANQDDQGLPGRPSSAELYRLASVQMLTQAEALLTSYRSDSRADRVDPSLEGWAREVLISTRLLLDSPAADDPELKPLLEDLELVVVQIVHLTGKNGNGSERELIDQTLENRDILPRLRTTIPAGEAMIGT